MLSKKGYDLTVIEVGSDGLVNPNDIREAIRPETFLVSVMTANNEIGTIQPIGEIAEIVKGAREGGQKLWFHTDAVQAIGKIPIDVNELGVDLLTISGHKIYAPKGVGALYVRRGVRLANQNLGGHQERETRGGTENVANIVAIGTASALALTSLNDDAEKIRSLRDEFEQFILSNVTDCSVNGAPDKRLPSISNVLFKGLEGEGLLINLDMLGVAVSTGSACSSGSIDPSPVIMALGVPEEEARGAVRFSFGKYNTKADLEYLKDAVPKAVETLRRLRPVSRPAAGS